MDQEEFSRRMRQLAGAQSHPVDQSLDAYTRILGSLGFAGAVRRTQAAALCVILGWGFVEVLHAVDFDSKVSTWGMALTLAAAGMMIIRRFPYWTPACALRDGLLTLSSYQLNDLATFLQHQRTDLTTVNNTLLSDLCIQLTMDRRRPAKSPRK